MTELQENEFEQIEVSKLTADTILNPDVYFYIDNFKDEFSKAKYESDLLVRASEVRRLEQVKKLLKAYKSENKKVVKIHNDNDLNLVQGEKGQILDTVDNFLKIIDGDEKFATLKFNELSYTPEHEVNGKTERWADADDSESRRYIEKKYGLFSERKLDDALRIVFKRNSYHPVKKIIENVEWDGIERINKLLVKWLKVDDSEYSREVTRLMFAGGINRLYRPGCKFDDMAVLIGTKQGEGKSTFVRWLALSDTFFREVNEIDGQKGIEALEGGWICEMSELLALTRTKEVEAVKSYLTKLSDVYRRPFDKRVTEHPRQCIFIGTTNKEQFLTDKTGNRRFYPLKVNQSGYELFNYEQEIKADILQCWSEAKSKFDKGEMLPFADKKVLSDIRKAQAKAVEDDYRVGLIEKYIEDKDEVCIREIIEKALEQPYNNSRRDSNEISLILQSFSDWERLGRKRTTSYGNQVVWSRKFDTLPFE